MMIMSNNVSKLSQPELKGNCFFQQLSGLAAWQLGGLKRRLPWDFACADFIKNLVPYCPSALVPSKAFTMAEILISLTIIGIIAAITLPALQANINEKTWATKRKALYSRMSQAIALMPNLNGYGVVFNEQGGINEAQTAQKAAQAFISDGLSKVLKINNICDGSTAEGLKKCGFPGEIRKMGKNAPKMQTPTKLTEFYNRSFFGAYSQIDTNAAAFETVNGESVLTFYNPYCGYNTAKYDSTHNLIQPTMCVNFVSDLNGPKGPNQVGKDIWFMTAFYPTDSEIVLPIPIIRGTVYVNKSVYPDFNIGLANAECRKKFGQGTRMTNIEELKSLFLNRNLGYYSSDMPYFMQTDIFISSTVLNGEMYALATGYGFLYTYAVNSYSGDNGNTNKIQCVKSNN